MTDEYKRAKRSGADPELEAVLAQRFGSVQRLLNTLDDTDERLRLLDARLGAAVAGRGRDRARRGPPRAPTAWAPTSTAS